MAFGIHTHTATIIKTLLTTMTQSKLLSRVVAGMAFIFMSMPVMGATFVGDRDDFRDETIYFAMTTRFYDGDPKNNVLSWDKQDVQIANNDPDWRGDFAGLIEKMDYIKYDFHPFCVSGINKILKFHILLRSPLPAAFIAEIDRREIH